MKQFLIWSFLVNILYLDISIIYSKAIYDTSFFYFETNQKILLLTIHHAFYNQLFLVMQLFFFIIHGSHCSFVSLVLLHLWSRVLGHSFYDIQEGVMNTNDEETRRYFKHSSVQVLLCPRSAGKGSWAKKQV